VTDDGILDTRLLCLTIVKKRKERSMARKEAKRLPLGRGKLGFKVSESYAVPAARVWEAITKAEHVQKFFTTRVTGDFGPDLEPVEWHWKKYGTFPLLPTTYRKEKMFEFVWMDHSGAYLTTVTFTLKKKGKLTHLEIHERGWKQEHLGNAFDNCSGWTIYLTYLKAYLLLGKDLRTEKW
jgi:uncharacterized protein YndB with AHSA1/START domain